MERSSEKSVEILPGTVADCLERKNRFIKPDITAEINLQRSRVHQSVTPSLYVITNMHESDRSVSKLGLVSVDVRVGKATKYSQMRYGLTCVGPDFLRWPLSRYSSGETSISNVLRLQ
jgi:hypothetical protein